MNASLSIPLCLAALLVPGPSQGTAAVEAPFQPLSAAAAIVRAVELVAGTSPHAVFAIRSVLAEGQASQESEQVAVTLELTVFAPDEGVAREAVQQLGRRIASRPWRGEDDGPEYSRWVSAFHARSSTGPWAPGHEDGDLAGMVAVNALVVLVFDARDLVREPLPEESERGNERLLAFARDAASHAQTSMGQVDVAMRMLDPSPGLHERVFRIRPARASSTHVRAQICNFLYLLDSSGEGLGRVTRVELRPAETGSPVAWSFLLDFGVRSTGEGEDRGR